MTNTTTAAVADTGRSDENSMPTSASLRTTTIRNGLSTKNDSRLSTVMPVSPSRSMRPMT